jgi:hypothetical protein
MSSEFLKINFIGFFVLYVRFNLFGSMKSSNLYSNSFCVVEDNKDECMCEI